MSRSIVLKLETNLKSEPNFVFFQAVKTIRAFNKRIKACHFHKSKGLKREPNDTNGPDLDTKIAELQVCFIL